MRHDERPAEDSGAVLEAIEDVPTEPRHVFADRRTAGRLLGDALRPIVGSDAIILGIPRGGMVVASAVARTLSLPLDVWLVHELVVPFRPDVALGALAEGACLVLDRPRIAWAGLSGEALCHLVHRVVYAIRERAVRYRDGRRRCDVRGKTVVIVGDGIATAHTMRAAVRAVRKCGAAAAIVAIPVAPPTTVASVRSEADEVVSLVTTHQFHAAGAWYEDFHHVADREVVEILAAATLPALLP